MTQTLATITPERDRCLPVDEAFISMLPDAGLPRGRVMGCTGPAAVSIALALVSRSAAAGSWLAAVGVPTLGVEAAAEFGLPLSRMVMVDRGRGPVEWAERVAAAADGFEIVMTIPPAGAERMARKIQNRLRARGVVLIIVGASTSQISCDIEFSTTEVAWAGLGDGHGSLVARRAIVRVGGRRVARPSQHEMWLPGPSGRVEVNEQVEPLNTLEQAI